MADLTNFNHSTCILHSPAAPHLAPSTYCAYHLLLTRYPSFQSLSTTTSLSLPCSHTASVLPLFLSHRGLRVFHC